MFSFFFPSDVFCLSIYSFIHSFISSRFFVAVKLFLQGRILEKDFAHEEGKWIRSDKTMTKKKRKGICNYMNKRKKERKKERKEERKKS